MEATRRTRTLGMVGIALLAALMLAAFARMGGLGIEPRVSVVNAAAATAISSISVSDNCGALGGFTGTVTLNGTSNGSITLGLFYHVPGNGTWFYSGLSATASFGGGNTATYNFPSYSAAGANSYRIQVLDANGLNGATTKSRSVPGCSGTTTTETTIETTTETTT